MDSLRRAIQAFPATRQNVVASVAVGTALYLILVRALRFRRRDQIVRDYGYPKRTLASMTVDEACNIRKELANLEFPETMKTSLFFALFKTYAIPSISKLLLATGQLSSDATASKRAADTSVLVTEMTQAGRSSDRIFDAIARMNFLHNRYRRAGKISDDDLLYTLSLFALEPSRWVTRLDWREFSPVELCAEGVLWRDIGEMMEIPYTALEPYLEGGGGDDGLTWLRALEQWSLKYEAEKAVPEEVNRKVAMGTLDILLFNAPVVSRRFFTGVVSAVLDSRTRTAMKFPEPNRLHRALAATIFAARRLFVGWLSLPRPSWLAVKRLDEEKDPITGKYWTYVSFSHPWYIKPTFANRWGPEAMMLRLLGGVIPSKDAEYCPDGYDITEIGPEKMKGKGHDEMDEIRSQMKQRRGLVGCPMGL
ncbi:uncharacterized protein DNG_09071 [Cephalotrichum gorgonifer]|uniref:ER-bound oxygenase mpaB/mpaB'/Rubber oxygenase catalytic domain-containing protein n=1 Tax=Cephalotrichum gorgonifer TaxID=2041049 RepID=A0AAE8N561_9PEZI|nr:uncharacterized protein DNG_09071 [Cephalotrichum gorgonifer]